MALEVNKIPGYRSNRGGRVGQITIKYSGSNDEIDAIEAAILKAISKLKNKTEVT